MILLSIDASTKSTGVALFDNLKLLEYSCITSTSQDLIKRIHIMVDGIEKYLSENNVQELILEEVRPESSSPNIQTQKALMYLQGAIVMMVHDKYPGTKVSFIYPQQWRKHCNIKMGPYIKREQLKREDIQFVRDKFGIIVNDDIADAIGIGYGYALSQGINNRIEF